MYLEGRIQYRTYDDKSGVKRYVTEIVANQMMMLDSRNAGSTNDVQGAPDSSIAEKPEEDLPF